MTARERIARAARAHVEAECRAHGVSVIVIAIDNHRDDDGAHMVTRDAYATDQIADKMAAILRYAADLPLRMTPRPPDEERPS